MIVHLIGQLDRGGAEKQLFSLASALVRRGWRQAVVSFLPGGVWASRFAESGIPVACIPRSRITPWRYWRLRCLIRFWKPGVIVSWSPHLAVYADWLRGVGRPALVFNVRFDLTTDGLYSTPKKSLGLLKRTLERAAYVVSNSRRNLEALRDRGVRLPRSEVIYNVVVAGQRPAGRSGGRSADRGRRLAGSAKAHEVLLHAAARLATEGYAFELLLAGDGPERPRSKRWRRNWQSPIGPGSWATWMMCRGCSPPRTSWPILPGAKG